MKSKVKRNRRKPTAPSLNLFAAHGFALVGAMERVLAHLKSYRLLFDENAAQASGETNEMIDRMDDLIGGFRRFVSELATDAGKPDALYFQRVAAAKQLPEFRPWCDLAMMALASSSAVATKEAEVRNASK